MGILNIDLCGPRCECKRRCKSFTAGKPDLERACINACKTDTSITQESFLCSGQYVNEADFILDYGYDPCPNFGIGIPDVLDPLDTRGQKAEEFDQMKPVLLGIALLLLLGLLVLLLI